MAKRLFDLLLAGPGLVLLAPLLLLIALAVRLDSPGPVFYRQVRVGRGGREFRIHKFRTMTHAPGDRGPQITVGADARITRVGALLRRSKLDELAQLIDVLQGTMSLVGPRPEVPRYVALYPAALREKILSVRPGITDFASVEYRDEGTLLARSADPERTYREQVLPAKLALQARYVDEVGVWTDVKLIARTLRAVALD
ncbi:lipopolysaccharide/colanic/teichoic acid biosynthesis glycosyltransferase [Sphaerotilus hippei]|uniref:Lipopolysaccharide/colanic/teichoic acid biosynthesis glycosyltransferase n=1 Tax=Sphaerotilus hippei TaxID=744406 RepID=A0A318GVU6_9BURK|nr:sugar transferase [Sphaerotilus hippei]PXW93557.1 lipopolysaccharide/colanic/teichoic acid biosynthesis glycosyltransferase [Sphaerotilus hippei]